jgi:hypothetical protein
MRQGQKPSSALSLARTQAIDIIVAITGERIVCQVRDNRQRLSGRILPAVDCAHAFDRPGAGDPMRSSGRGSPGAEGAQLKERAIETATSEQASFLARRPRLATRKWRRKLLKTLEMDSE